MPRRELVWTPGAVDQFAAFLGRHADRSGIRKCVEQHLLAAANDLESAAQKWDGPVEEVWIYRFRCEDHKDGKIVAVYVQAELEAIDGLVAVLACGTVTL